MFRACVMMDDDIVIMHDNSIVLNATVHDVTHFQFAAMSLLRINYAFFHSVKSTGE